MNQMNHSRQLAKFCQRLIDIPNIKSENKRILSNVIDLHGVSVKFMLPDGGRLLDDREYKAIDETQKLSLPYKYIALEFYVSNDFPGETYQIVNGEIVEGHTEENSVISPKRIVYARERDEWIVLTVAFCSKHDGVWSVLPEIAIPRNGYLDRSKAESNNVPIAFAMQDQSVPFRDYADELAAFMCFMNVMQCSNVKSEKVAKTKNKKIKAAFQFDDYYILTIDTNTKQSSSGVSCAHRSPREHLRRGHIRRLFDGRKIWVNATVVGSGNGGVIRKDYRIAA